MLTVFKLLYLNLKSTLNYYLKLPENTQQIVTNAASFMMLFVLYEVIVKSSSELGILRCTVQRASFYS